MMRPQNSVTTGPDSLATTSSHIHFHPPKLNRFLHFFHLAPPQVQRKADSPPPTIRMHHATDLFSNKKDSRSSTPPTSRAHCATDLPSNKKHSSNHNTEADTSGSTGLRSSKQFADRKERKEEIFSALSGATSLALSTLQDVASLAPVPYLSEAAGLALSIWAAVQTTRNAKSSLLSLGEDACTLVYTVWTTCDEVLGRQAGASAAAKQMELGVDLDKHLDHGDECQSEKESEAEGQVVEKLNPQLEANLKKLCSTLQEVSAFATRTASRNVLSRFLTSDADMGKVADYQGKLKSALDLFTLQANITIQQVVSRMETQQKVMQAQMQTKLSSPPPYSSSGKIPPSAPAPVPTTPNSLSVPADVDDPVPASSSSSAPPPRPALQAGAEAFPAIFSFAGATFRTGNTTTSMTTRKTNQKSRTTAQSKLAESKTAPSTKDVGGDDSDDAMKDENEMTHLSAVAPEDVGEPRSASVHQPPQESESLPEIEYAPGSGSGNIQFISIAGDHNTSWVSDQSRNWDYGNVYGYNPSGGRSERHEENIETTIDENTLPSTSVGVEDLQIDRGGGEGSEEESSSTLLAARLGREAFAFGRNQQDDHIPRATHAYYTGRNSGTPSATPSPGRGPGMSARRRAERARARARRGGNANYWDAEGGRGENYENANMAGSHDGSYGGEYGTGYGYGQGGTGTANRHRYGPGYNKSSWY